MIFHKNKQSQFGNTHYGNAVVLHFNLKTNDKGVAVNTSQTTALKADDVVVLGELPLGMRLDDAQVIVQTEMTASMTGDLGVVYVDGEEDATVPQDKAFFGSDLMLHAAARLRTDTAKIVKLPKPAYLVLTLKGATNAQASDISVLVQGELLGDR